MGRLGDREEDGAGEFCGEKDRKKRAGKKDWKWRLGGTAREKRSIGRNAQEKRFRKSTAAENSVLSRKRAAP